MRSVCACLILVLLLPGCVRSQRGPDQGSQRDLLAVNGLDLDLSDVLNSLLQAEHQTGQQRHTRAPRLPANQVPKRAHQQGSRFALSLDVPTSILSVLIDLAKNQDMRSKAAANAQLMARIGKRK